MNKKEIGQVLAKARKERKVSYYKIQKESNVQRIVVKSIEKGNSNYTIDSLIDAAKVLGITIHAE